MIYFDNAATTPVSQDVLKVMEPYFSKNFGNPSSIYDLGREAKAALEAARRKAAKILGCKTEEIIFTSGATESNNLIIKGATFYWSQKLNRTPHIITSAIEHPSVLNACRWLKENFSFELTELSVSQEGIINVNELKQAIRENTAIISIMFGNNEVGSIQPIAEIAKIVKRVNNERRMTNSTPVILHSDAVQAYQFLNIDICNLGLDALSLTAHKFNGPKGIGLLYAKKGIKVLPLANGGSQEKRLRAGTENIPYIVGMVKAMELSQKLKAKNQKHIETLGNYLIKRVTEEIPDVILTGPEPGEKRLPHITSFIFKKIEGESILINLDLAGISASSGSACTSGGLMSSHVLLAMGYGDFLAHGSVRFSLGKLNKKSDIDALMKILPSIVNKLKKISPIK